MEKRLHLLLHGGESSLAPNERRKCVDDSPDEVVRRFHGLGVINSCVLPVDVVFEPLDGFFDMIHVAHEHDLQDEVGSPDVGHKDIGPIEQEMQRADD